MSICCHLLDEFFFYFFLIILPISRFCISLFLVFSLLLIFYLICPWIKIFMILFQQLSQFSHHKHWCSVFCQPICDLSGYIVCCQAISRWPYVGTIFPLLRNLFPVQTLPFIFHYHLFHCEGCALHMMDIIHFANLSTQIP